MADKESDQNKLLLQPELIPKETLITILTEKCSTLGSLKNFDHCTLVDLFYKNVAPMPQRKYRGNRRGKQMTKLQIQREKRKRKHDEISIFNTALNSGSGFSSSFNIQSANGTPRIKPPPSTINPERKIIKLGRGSLMDTSGSTNTRIKVTNNTLVKTSISQSKTVTNTASKSESQKEKDNTKNTGINGAVNHKSDLATSPKPNIVKIIPQQRNVSKIKLKRPSAITVDELSMETVPITTSSSAQEELLNQSVGSPCVKVAVNCRPTPSEALSPDTLTADIDEECSSSPTEESVLRKKFKRVSVTWP